MYKSRRKQNWFSQWNFSAIPYIIVMLLKKIRKPLFRVCAVMIGCWLSNTLPLAVDTAIKEIHASFDSYEKMKKEEKLMLEIKAANTERMILEEQQRKAREYEQKQKRLKEEERDAYLQEIEEMHKCITVGDRVWISWWGTENGPTPPAGNYNVGRIIKIDGFLIYGNWGNKVINWKDKPHFETLSAKEYKERLRKEEKRVAKLNAKTNKPKFKSWGIFPGTIYTGKDGREYISTIENGKLVQKLYKRTKE